MLLFFGQFFLMISQATEFIMGDSMLRFSIVFMNRIKLQMGRFLFKVL